MFQKIQKIRKEFPQTFWVLIYATFIDRFGGFLLFPFFSLYLTQQFTIGMTQVGVILMMFSLGGMFGKIIGGALADKIGRKIVLNFGLLSSGLGSLLMLIVNDLNVFLVLALILGILGDVAQPARQAMIADLLPKNKQSEGFGLLRVAINIAATIGPIIGGFIAAKSFSYLFILDAVFTCLTAVIVFLKIPETKGSANEVEGSETETSILDTLKNYKTVLKDGAFMAFMGISILMILVYMQMYSTMSVYLRDFHGFTPDLLGWILSLNAIMVVTMQFWITRVFSKYPPFITLAIGTLFLGVGFTMFGLVSGYFLLFFAMAILTVGEMVFLPVGHALAANFAPPDKRGRYMAVWGFSWAIPNLFGTILAGLIMDNHNANWVWYSAGIISVITILGFLLLNKFYADRIAENAEKNGGNSKEESPMKIDEKKHEILEIDNTI